MRPMKNTSLSAVLGLSMALTSGATPTLAQNQDPAGEILRQGIHSQPIQSAPEQPPPAEVDRSDTAGAAQIRSEAVAAGGMGGQFELRTVRAGSCVKFVLNRQCVASNCIDQFQKIGTRWRAYFPSQSRLDACVRGGCAMLEQDCSR